MCTCCTHPHVFTVSRAVNGLWMPLMQLYITSCFFREDPYAYPYMYINQTGYRHCWECFCYLLYMYTYIHHQLPLFWPSTPLLAAYFIVVQIAPPLAAIDNYVHCTVQWNVRLTKMIPIFRKELELKWFGYSILKAGFSFWFKHSGKDATTPLSGIDVPTVVSNDRHGWRNTYKHAHQV